MEIYLDSADEYEFYTTVEKYEYGIVLSTKLPIQLPVLPNICYRVPKHEVKSVINLMTFDFIEVTFDASKENYTNVSYKVVFNHVNTGKRFELLDKDFYAIHNDIASVINLL